MADEEITRRQFVQTAATGALSMAAFGAFVSGCKNESGAGGGEAKEGGGGGEAKEGGGGGGELDCTDTSGLTEAEKKTRTQLKYVEQTEKPSQRCDNCQLYTAPASGEGCGTCTVVKGPINPAGWCSSWVKKSA